MAFGMDHIDTEFRRRINRLVKERRKSTLVNQTHDVRFSATDIYYEFGQPLRRHVIVLLSAGCSIPTCTMCPFTNYNLFGTGEQPPDPVAQVYRALRKREAQGVDIISLYNDGSFFADSELGVEQRASIAQLVNDANIPRLMVESLPQFITPDRIEHFTRHLDAKLTVGIGLQSENDFIRQVCVGTSFNKKQFELSLDVLNKYDVNAKIYVMVKPPFLGDGEAYHDVLSTSKYLMDLRVSNVTLCPTRVADNTIVADLYRLGIYRPPHPCTVLACLRDSLSYVDSRVAMVNLTAKDFASITSLSSEDKIATGVFQALQSFDKSHRLKDLILPGDLEQEFSEHRKDLITHSSQDLRINMKEMLHALEEER
ncbi:hypothetical protein MF410_15070 [Rhizobium sp. C104]|uniref:hypothetical protein n=1 Tax=Rhizobium sp. C104 TaxID=2917727 RepID=UPI001EF82A5A|nr:hypothetical protein [Rhizobium sp. C104]ULJ77366.1 hypothetical protein MF410_15070 [Rhizobium sp. C104]